MQREALADLLFAFVGNIYGLSVLDPDLVDALFPTLNTDDCPNELSGDLWGKLWPGEVAAPDSERSPDCPEAKVAQARVDLIVARILQEAAGHPERLLELAGCLTRRLTPRCEHMLWWQAMPRGAAVIRYEGARGVVWRLKYADAAGRQVQETLGPEREGWTRQRAAAELRERLVRVERRGWRKPAPLTFGVYAERWFREGETRRDWKPGTIIEYRSVRRRLETVLGPMPLAAIRPRHVAGLVDELQRPTRARPKGYAAATIVRDLGVLSAIFETAVREELVETNPARRAERPKIPRRRWRVLEPAEVARVERAFAELAEAAEGRGRAWLEQARLLFLLLVVTGVRRHEAIGLRWRDVDLIENILRVERSKSDAGERSIAIPPKLAEELWQHRRRSSFRSEAERVFCHPENGAKLNGSRFADDFRSALERSGIGEHVRPFHDLRHASLTLGAANGESAIALMTRAGHANMATTKVYLHLAGSVFREEAERLEELAPSR